MWKPRRTGKLLIIITLISPLHIHLLINIIDKPVERHTASRYSPNHRFNHQTWTFFHRISADIYQIITGTLQSNHLKTNKQQLFTVTSKAWNFQNKSGDDFRRRSHMIHRPPDWRNANQSRLFLLWRNFLCSFELWWENINTPVIKRGELFHISHIALPLRRLLIKVATTATNTLTRQVCKAIQLHNWKMKNFKRALRKNQNYILFSFDYSIKSNF